MRIIERGIAPGDKVHQAFCRCGTKIEFSQSEAKYVADQRDGDYLSISCPICHCDITKSVHQGAHEA